MAKCFKSHLQFLAPKMSQILTCDGNHNFEVEAIQECYDCKKLCCRGCGKICKETFGHQVSQPGVIKQPWKKKAQPAVVMYPPTEKNDPDYKIQKLFNQVLTACKSGNVNLLHESLVRIKSECGKEKTIAKLMTLEKHMDHGSTAIHLAAKYGYAPCLLMLLHFLEDYSVLKLRSKEGSTALMLASVGQTLAPIPRTEMIVIDAVTKEKHIKHLTDTFLAKVDTTTLENANKKARILAEELVESVAWNRQIDMNSFRCDLASRASRMTKNSKLIHDLLERKPHAIEKEGFFPTHILFDHRSVILLLLSKEYVKYVDVPAVDPRGHFALHYAIRGDRWDFFKILEDHGLKPKESGKDTLIHFAAEQGKKACTEMLLTEDKYAKVYMPIVLQGTPDSSGKSVIHHVITRANMHNYISTLKVIIKCVKNAFKDIKALKALFSQKYNGQTVLHVAAENSFSQAIEVILAEKAVDLDEQNDAGETVLHLAARNGDKELIQRFIKAGANPSIKNKKGCIPKDLLDMVEVSEKLDEMVLDSTKEKEKPKK